MDWTLWLIIPLVGAIIGYVTNTIAVTMLFRPHKPKSLGPLRLHGLIPKRQPDLAHKIGDVVGTHLVEKSDLVAAFEHLEIGPMISELIDKALAAKVQELQAMPLIGAFLTPDRIDGIRDGIVSQVVMNKHILLEHIEKGIEEHLDIRKIVKEKVAAFPTTRLEELVLEVARKELRAIELWGAVLGFVIGLIQVGCLELLR